MFQIPAEFFNSLAEKLGILFAFAVTVFLGGMLVAVHRSPDLLESYNNWKRRKEEREEKLLDRFERLYKESEEKAEKREIEVKNLRKDIASLRKVFEETKIKAELAVQAEDACIQEQAQERIKHKEEIKELKQYYERKLSKIEQRQDSLEEEVKAS